MPRTGRCAQPLQVVGGDAHQGVARADQRGADHPSQALPLWLRQRYRLVQEVKERTVLA